MYRRTAYPRRQSSGIGLRLLIAVGVALFSFFSYLSTRSTNPVTGETQFVDLTPDQEIAMGLQAAPQMAQQYGGLHPDQNAQAFVDEVGQRIVASSAARNTPYQYDFHLLADSRTINAFALPGGQIFITAALLSRLETEGQLAGVLGHEVGHVVARHSAEHLAKQKLTQGLVGAAGVASDAGGARMAAAIGQMLNLQYGRSDELESDRLGVVFMAEAGYDPRSLIGVMRILEEASGGSRQPEFSSTHPSPANRVQAIEAAIASAFPSGIPSGLIP